MTPTLPLHHARLAAILGAVLPAGDLSPFFGKGRMPEIVAARTIAAWVLREWRLPLGDRMSFPEIAATMGRTNHSTIITQVRRIEHNPALLARARAVLEMVDPPTARRERA